MAAFQHSPTQLDVTMLPDHHDEDRQPVAVEIDHTRGVMYVHTGNESTVFRLCRATAFIVLEKR